MSISQIKRKERTVRWFIYANIGIAVWAICYGLELQQRTLDGMLFYINLEYLGVAFLPALWIMFLLKFTGREKWLTPPVVMLIFLDPAITLLAVWTNQWHYLHYKSVAVDNTGPFPMLDIQPGIIYILHTIYFYLVLVFGAILLLLHYQRTEPFYRRQILLLIPAFTIPWLVNLLYLLDLRPFRHLDLTPYAFLFSSFFFSIGLLRFRFLDIVPMAREKVIDAMTEGVIILNRRQHVVDVNTAMKHILGPAGESCIGRPFTELVPEAAHLLEIKDEQDKKSELTLKSAWSDDQVYEITCTRLSSRKMTIDGLVLVFRNITGQKATEEKLRSLNELKDQLFSIISHDLRSPITGVLSLVSLAEEDIIGPEEFRSYLPSLSSSLKDTTTLMDNLLAWAKSQLKGEYILPMVFDLKDMVDTDIAICRTAADIKNLTIQNEVPGHTMVNADPDMIHLVVRNLLTNAVKFCKVGGIITVQAKHDADQTRVCVSDTGIGMDEEVVARLFRNAAFSTRGTHNEKGTGLGLLLCKDFVEKNNGRIWVESTPGKGSRFYFTLNSAQIQQAAMAKKQYRPLY